MFNCLIQRVFIAEQRFMPMSKAYPFDIPINHRDMDFRDF